MKFDNPSSSRQFTSDIMRERGSLLLQTKVKGQYNDNLTPWEADNSSSKLIQLRSEFIFSDTCESGVQSVH